MRSELEQQLQEAGRHLQLDWSEQRSALIREGVAPWARARRRRQVLASSVAGLAVILGASLLLARSLGGREVLISPTSPEASVSAPVADALGSQSTVDSGGAWFEVPRQAPGRSFRVKAGEVSVEVLGTRFLVERMDDAVLVLVDHGRVQVRWPGHSKLLTDGERLEVRPTATTPPPLAPEPERLPPEPGPISVDGGDIDVDGPEASSPEAKKALKKPAHGPQPEWKRLAEQGDFPRAFAALKGAGRAPRDEPEELLLAADVARLSHHPLEAVTPLQRIISRHEKDPRTPLAAFTLGRVLLDDLGRPHEAASAFAEARALAPTGPLAEDALAREVEANSRAGDMARARALALQYQARYPAGARLRVVRRHGGLE